MTIAVSIKNDDERLTIEVLEKNYDKQRGSSDVGPPFALVGPGMQRAFHCHRFCDLIIREQDPHRRAKFYVGDYVESGKLGEPTYLVRKRSGWFKRIRVTVQEVDNPHGFGPERWRASFRFIWDAETFIDGLCRNSPCYRAIDSDYGEISPRS